MADYSLRVAADIEARIQAVSAHAPALKANTEKCWFCETLATALLAILDRTPAELYAAIDRRLHDIAHHWGCAEMSWEQSQSVVEGEATASTLN